MIICYTINTNQKTGYGKIPHYNWYDTPSILREICNLVQQYTHEIYDYVLVHIYPNGNSGINWHFDSEAMNTPIASVSLGASRKFRLRERNKTTGWDFEYVLNNGDLIWMHGSNPITGRLSCQQVYMHTVPIERKVKEARINLTFRQYE